MTVSGSRDGGPGDEGAGASVAAGASTDVTAPDPAALRRRVLLTGLVTLALFLVLAYLIASAGLADWWLLVAMVAVYGLVVRPMMRPVRQASKLRRSLAYQAFLEQKHKDEQ